MPQILEMKEIDGDLWCKIPRATMMPPNDMVSLFYPEELKKLKHEYLRDFLIDLMRRYEDN